MRIVLDVNVWISGLLWRGVPKKLIDLAQDGIVTIVISEPILSELEEVLAREKFQSRMRSLGITTEELMTSASQLSENCIPILVNVPQLRDPDDAMILGTAIV
jgi:putative PIN family toxin of toxin-antitoxin system